MLVALVGMMGVGKSTAGEQLADRLGSSFCDLDTLVAARAHMPVQQVFEQHGEAFFRQLEHEALQQLTEQPSQCGSVLATGGGVVKTAACRVLLVQSWHVIWLKASASTLVRHLQHSDDNRPLLTGTTETSLVRRLEKLLAERQGWYEEVSQISIAVDDKPVPEVVDEIMTHLFSNRICDIT